MADIRITSGRRSRQPGDTVGIQLNTFGLDKLASGVGGQELEVIVQEAATPMVEEAKAEWYQRSWRHVTGASGDSIALVTTEVAERRVRVQFQAGGELLTSDPRNPSGVDYAPFLEFREGGGVIRDVFFSQQEETVRRIHAGVKALVEGLLS